MGSQADELPVRASRSLRQGLVKRRRRRMLRRLNGYARFLLCLVLAYGLYRFWASPMWDWNGQMTISGNRLVTRQTLLDRLEIPKGTPLYRLNPQYIATQLEGVPAIARVAVRRWLFPARLELNVIERQALVEVAEDRLPEPGETVPGPSPSPSRAPGAKPSPGASARPSTALTADSTPRRWIDQEGVVFSAPPRLMTARFGILVHTDLQPGSHLPQALQAHLFDLLNLWPKDEGGRLDLRNPSDVYANINGWPVRLGDVDDIQLKFAMFQHLEPLAAKYKDRLKYINLRFPDSPTLVLKTGTEIKPGDGSKAPTPTAAPASPAASKAPTTAPSAAPTPMATPEPKAKPTKQ